MAFVTDRVRRKAIPMNQSPTYQQRIDKLAQTKLEHTAQKFQTVGYINVDDDGRIPWPEPIPFTPKSNHPSGGCYGAKCIGENFRAWLDVHPLYIHPNPSILLIEPRPAGFSGCGLRQSLFQTVVPAVCAVRAE